MLKKDRALSECTVYISVFIVKTITYSTLTVLLAASVKAPCQ